MSMSVGVGVGVTDVQTFMQDGVTSDDVLMLDATDVMLVEGTDQMLLGA